MDHPFSSIRTRLLVSFLAVAIGSASVLSLYLLNEIEAYGLRRLEERLETESRMLAAILESAYETIVMARRRDEPPLAMAVIEAHVLSDALHKVGSQTVSRVRVVDAKGFVVADSTDLPYTASYLPALDNVGDLPEIRRVLRGEPYGAATRIREDGRVTLCVAVPISASGKVIGAVYSSSSTFSVLTLIRDYRTKLALLIMLFTVVTLLVTEGLSRWLSRPLRSLKESVSAFAGGDHTVRVRPEGSSEIRAVGDAFNVLADEVQTMVTELRAEERRKSRFVSDVSHELRTPLTAIRGAAETLLEGGVEPDDEKRFLETVVHESDRLTRLANDLLSLQRIEGAAGELPLRRLRLEDAARSAAAALEPLLQERGVRLSLEGSAPEVLGDADRLQQVVANLLDNASRLTRRGSEVRIRLGAEGDDVTLSVLDEGPGIPEEDLAGVFDRFYRSQRGRDRESGGAGLGLAIVKAIVEAHGGTVSGRNREGRGCEFTVRLPAAQRPPSAA